MNVVDGHNALFVTNNGITPTYSYTRCSVSAEKSFLIGDALLNPSIGVEDARTQLLRKCKVLYGRILTTLYREVLDEEDDGVFGECVLDAKLLTLRLLHVALEGGEAELVVDRIVVFE